MGQLLGTVTGGMDAGRLAQPNRSHRPRRRKRRRWEDLRLLRALRQRRRSTLNGARSTRFRHNRGAVRLTVTSGTWCQETLPADRATQDESPLCGGLLLCVTLVTSERCLAPRNPHANRGHKTRPHFATCTGQPSIIQCRQSLTARPMKAPSAHLICCGVTITGAGCPRASQSAKSQSSR